MKFLGYEITITKIEKPAPPVKDIQQMAYLALNNLYLNVQRKGFITLNDRLRLETLVAEAYDPNDLMRDWWFGEFNKLQGWLDV